MPPVMISLVAVALCALVPLRAQDVFAAIPQRMQAFVNQGEISGAVTLVATKDRILSLSAVGRSDIASGRKMRTNDLFWIASMTKPMTSVAAGILVDEGKLNFNDPVEKYLPEFHDLWVLQDASQTHRVLVPTARPITVRDLLTHTSGLGEYTVYGPQWTLAEMVQPGAWAFPWWRNRRESPPCFHPALLVTVAPMARRAGRIPGAA
jgi:CubicO group peptidase (beta-lactamase class C family)